MELLFIHNSRQSKIRNEEIRIILRCSEQQVLRLQVAMHNAVVVKVSDSRKGSSDKISGIRFVVIAFTADAIEQLASKRKVGDKVNCTQSDMRFGSAKRQHTVIHGLEVIHQSQDVPVAHGNSLQDGNFVPNLYRISL
jgi:hypothetical protein